MILEVEDLTKAFGGVAAVRGATFSVGQGESVGLVGPNGAGKTTVFDCIGGQLVPDTGRVRFDGHPIDRLAPFRRARRGIGRTFQRLEVFSELTVREHVLVAARVRWGGGRLWKDLLGLSAPTADEQVQAAAVLAMVGLDHVADVPVAALGLGMCRLVELARALVGEPRLLLADEPSSGLDARESRELAGVLRRLQAERGMALLLVEHDLAMVGAVVDRTIVMDLGRVVADGPLDEVMAEPEVRRAYLGAR
ncbi:MAG: ABC transporter ATP-binding protein [Acidimicrobiales bacterium]